MLETPSAMGGMVVAPHHLAAQAGLRVLREGGNAIEAMVAAASTIAVVYPHMNGLGGDNFWLIDAGSGAPLGIDACGPTGAAVDADYYRARGHQAIPARGPAAANTVAGAVAGWMAALELSAKWGGRMTLARGLATPAQRRTRRPAPATPRAPGSGIERRHANRNHRRGPNARHAPASAVRVPDEVPFRG